MTLQVGDRIIVGDKRAANFSYNCIVGASAKITQVGHSPFVEIEVQYGHAPGTWGIHPSDCIPIEATNANYAQFLKKDSSLLGE